jgi:hypothetical protein
MPIFIGVHDMGEPMPDEKAKDAWSRYQESIKKHGGEC